MVVAGTNKLPTEGLLVRIPKVSRKLVTKPVKTCGIDGAGSRATEFPTDLTEPRRAAMEVARKYKVARPRPAIMSVRANT